MYVSIHVFPWINWLWSSLFAETVQVNLCEWFWSRGWRIYFTPLRHWTEPWLLSFFSEKAFYHTSRTVWALNRETFSVSRQCQWIMQVGSQPFQLIQGFCQRRFIGCFIYTEVPLLHFSLKALEDHSCSHKHTHALTNINYLFLSVYKVKAKMSFVWNQFSSVWLSFSGLQYQARNAIIWGEAPSLSIQS